MTKSFNKLATSLLMELSPASLEDTMGSSAEKVVKKVLELPGKSQHWQYLQNLNPDIREEIVREIIKNVFSDNEDNTYSSTIDNVSDLKEAIKDAIAKVASENPEKFKATSKTIIGFLADRLANKELLGNVKFTTRDGDETLDKKVTQKQVRAALNKVLAGEEMEGSSEKPTMSPTPRKAEFAVNKDYYLKTYEEIPSGTLTGDLSVAYDRLSVVSGEVHSGSKFVNVLRNSNMGPHFLKQLFAAGILEEIGEENVDSSDSEGFNEPESDYMERITRGAREDFRSSDLNPKYGGIQFD